MPSLIARQNLFSRALCRVSSVVAFVGDSVRRVRYRRGDLWRVSPVEMHSDQTAVEFDRRPEMGWSDGPHAALVCPLNSRVVYDLTLPANATVAASCALGSTVATNPAAEVEFRIRVRTEHLETSTACLVTSGTSPFGRRARTLRVQAPEAGPAQIVLTTASGQQGIPPEVTAIWHEPRVESPRSMAELLSMGVSAISEQGIRGLWYRAMAPNSERLYKLWVREHEPSPDTLRAQREWSIGQGRVFTLITLLAEPTGWRPRETAASIQSQSYPGWECVLVGTEDSVSEIRSHAARFLSDPRVRLLTVPSGSTRADAWNLALQQARGEFAAVIGQNDEVGPETLYEIALALERSPDCDLLYSDEDRLSQHKRQRCDPTFKPDWSPERLLSSNYVGRLAMMRVRAAVTAGGFRNDVEGAEEWDLILRLSSVTSKIQRIARCLYHRYDAEGLTPGSAKEPGSAIIQEHWRKLGVQATVSKAFGAYRSNWPVQGEPLVSIVIPNRDAAVVFEQCVSGLLGMTSYRRHELIVVDNGSTDRRVLELYSDLERNGNGRVVPFDRPFNFSAACNAGAAVARGDLLLFLNNDIEVIDPDWLEELIRWAQRPDIGVVGAKLLYPDRTIQHAGIVFGLGLVGHVFSRAREGAKSVFGSAESYRNYLAVTGACQMLRTDVFRKLGGFDERFRLSFSDVVLCMEAAKAGYRVMYTPHARLIHHESFTRKRDDSPQDMELLARYLQAGGFIEDPYFHPELNAKSALPEVRAPFDPTPRQVVHGYVERVLAAAAPQ